MTRRDRLVIGVLLGLGAAMVGGPLVFVLLYEPTRIVVESRVADATLENVRWVSDADADRQVLLAETLLPGQTAPPANIGSSREDRTGHIEIDLVLDGGRVVLHAEDRITAAEHRTTVIAIDTDTRVANAALARTEE